MLKNSKKIFPGVAVGALAAALLLAACGSDNNPAPSVADASEGPQTQAASTDTGTTDIACAAGLIKASGSSAQSNAMMDWISTYQRACPEATIEYQGTGSGAGITDFINGDTAFAGTDAAISGTDQEQASARCTTGEAINIPTVGSAIAVVYHVPGVTDLVLTPAVLAQIFSGAIERWDDPAIADINPDATLPAERIQQYHRADSSGTTDNFTRYLAAASAGEWSLEPGKEWAAEGGLGAKGSEGMAASVQSTPYAIGYLDLSFLEQTGLPAAQIDNGGGAIALTAENAAESIAAAQLAEKDHDLQLELDFTTTTGYPLVMVTYEVSCLAGLPAAEQSLMRNFLQFTNSDAAQDRLSHIGYVPITGEVRAKARAAIEAMAAQ